MSYYNTTNQTGESLKTKVVKAESQKVKILRYLNQIKEYGVPTSSSRIWMFVFGGEKSKTPLTSIRRAVSDLVLKDEVAEYTGEMVKGYYNGDENLVTIKK
jgi:hypothetical protein